MRKFGWMVFCFCFGIGTLTAQTIIKGKVVNAKNGESLPFVNITLTGTTLGTTADVQGRFSISIDRSVNAVVTYVGFESQNISLAINSKEFLLIRLKERTTELNEVVVRPGDNPALKIIRKVIANKSFNDPESLSSYTYNSYNKLALTFEKGTDSIKYPPLAKKEKSEKEYHKMDSFANKNDIFVTESYTEKKHVKPNLNKETVLGNRMTGVKDPFFAFLATNLQPFSFYQDFIPLSNRNYTNPISKGSISKYDYTIIDTLYHASDSVFIITFEPLPNRAFDGLKGQLYISSDRFAVEHVIAQPHDDKVLIETRIQQKYEKHYGHWFPVQLNAELRFKEYQIGRQKLKYVSRSFISNISIGNDIPKKEFGLLNTAFDTNANRKDELFWKLKRMDSLSVKEKNTYRFYDSLGPKLKVLNGMVKAIEGFALGKFKAGSFYLPIEHFIKINQYEGTRLGFGLETGKRISKFFTLGGYTGYGFKDKALKYGSWLQFNLASSKDALLTFSYKQDVNEPGNAQFIKSPTAPIGNESYRIWSAYRMDSMTQYKVELSLRPLRFSQVSFFAQQLTRNPAYAYKFITDTDITGERKNYTIGEIGIQWRFALKENYTQIGNGKVVTSYTYPQINLAVSRAATEFLNGQYDFTRVEAKIDYQKNIRGVGKTTLQINTGKIIGDVPYPFLFNARGSKTGNSFNDYLFIQNYFQTMGLYEFASDEFAYLFLNHNFGRIAGMKSKFFRPELVVAHNMGFGSLKNKDKHQGISFNTMEQGFYESGLLLNNLIRFKYVKLLYFGIGAGAFYRYGSYALPKQSDNLAFKINLTADF
jgi:hypothetical protein